MKTSWTSINFVVTIVTIVCAICAAFAGTIPCHPNTPSGFNIGYPHSSPSTFCASATPRKVMG
eukprot:31451-Pelagococcus_subviridis.AAC.4